MKRRAKAYGVCLLASLLLSVVPCAIMFDLVVTYDRWENWYWQGQPHPRPDFSEHLPFLARAEHELFKWLVAPPSSAWQLISRRSATAYAFPYTMPTGSATEALASLPPIALALEHLQIAIPFWFLLLGIIYELCAIAIRSRRVRRGVA